MSASVTFTLSYVLASNGPLTTLWAPPPSCLSTTTCYNSSFYLGYQSALGADLSCYPPAQTAPAGNANTTKSAVNAITIQYYSLGICPSGWTYVLPCLSFLITLIRL